jgi:hypothetical protein
MDEVKLIELLRKNLTIRINDDSFFQDERTVEIVFTSEINSKEYVIDAFSLHELL